MSEKRVGAGNDVRSNLISLFPKLPDRRVGGSARREIVGPVTLIAECDVRPGCSRLKGKPAADSRELQVGWCLKRRELPAEQLGLSKHQRRDHRQRPQRYDDEPQRDERPPPSRPGAELAGQIAR